jgi:protein-disulfide isomerase
MRLRFLLISFVLVASVAAALGLAVLSLPSRQDVARQMSFEQKVRNTLLSNPEIFAEAGRVLQKRSDRRRVAERKSSLRALKKVLRSPRGLPVLGNPKANITVVEFFDYRCPYCKQSLDVLRRLISDDPGLRLVFKEFPILGPQSVYASRMAIASTEQGKYLELHHALMSHRGQFDQKSLLAIARGVGLDIDRLRADMRKQRVGAIIEEARFLADKLAITGTPAMIIGDEVVPGYVDLVALKTLVLDARRKCTTC